MSQQHPFRFGVINEQMKPHEDWLAHVRRAESLGYATFLLRDHFVPDFFGDQYAPVAALMAAAAATQTLHIGTLVIDNDYRHPVILAKEAATLHLLSGGRFELGIGAGWLRSEYEQAGMPYDAAGVRISRLEESLQIIKGLWSSEPVTFSGQHYTINKIDGFPKPERPLPVLIGAGQKRMLTLAGREADIVSILTTSVASGTLSPDPAERLASTVQQKLAWIREGACDRYDQLELSLIPSILLTDNRETRAERYIRDQRWDGITVEQVLAMPSVFIGSVDEIITQMVERRAQYGISYYVIADALMEAAAPIVTRMRGT
jgi:probable F420-dependent oxidoreductase